MYGVCCPVNLRYQIIIVLGTYIVSPPNHLVYFLVNNSEVTPDAGRWRMPLPQ